MTFKIVRIIIVCIGVLLFTIVGFGLVLRSHYIHPILMYHYVLDTQEARHDRRIVRPQTLESQLRFLKANRCQVIPLEKLGALLHDKKKISKNTIVITFDDGHLDNYTNAYPLLKKYNMPATMFIIVDAIGKPGFVTKEQLREMDESGLITIASHSLNGEHLPSLRDKQALWKEVYDSKKRLEAIIGKPVNCFSYPIGGFTEEIRGMVIDAGYSAAVATSPGVDYPDDDVFALKRIRISESSKNTFIFWFESSGLYRYILSLRKKYELQKKSR